jgi:hypothetical protein
MVFPFFYTFTHHFQIKLSTHNSNLNSKFISMSELEFILLTRVLIQNFNSMELVSRKRAKSPHSKHSGHIEDDIMQNHEQKAIWKKVKTLDSMDKQTSFLAPCPSALGQF